MLKFLRKYQLILLAVGGSLLMVVFLLQPVLQQLTPDPRKEKIAKIGDKTILMGDQFVANSELEVLGRFVPEFLAIMGIEEGDDSTAHWMLLKHEAERLGVIGVQTDGADWIEELAIGLAQQQIQLFRRFGQPVTAEQAQQIADQQLQRLNATKQALMRVNRGLDEAAFNRVLSQARGVMRVRQLYDSAPKLGRERAIGAFLEGTTAILTDQIVLGPELLEREVGAPSDADIAAFFDRYKDATPDNTDEGEGGNRFGFGYRLPARVKLEWLVLEPSRIAGVVVPDPVAVRRRWQSTNTEGRDFAADRAAIEQEVRDETVARILTDADEVIRGEILRATRGLEKEGIYRALPDGWSAPDLEAIAQLVVESVRERHGLRIPLPRVIRRTDAWQTPVELASLPVVGQAAFRVGNQVVRVSELPSLVRGIGEDTRVAVQVGMPIIDPPAATADGSRCYITVLEARGESPPDSVGEIRDRVAADIVAQRAFELHAAQLGAYREAAIAGGLDAVASLFADARTTPPEARENIYVTRDRLGAATFNSQPDTRADSAALRGAVMDAGASLDPLAAPDSLPVSEAFVAVEIPGEQSVVVARIRAKRPRSLDDFRRVQLGVVAEAVNSMVRDAREGDGPLSFAALSSRLGYESLRKRRDDDAG